jgi:cytolysin (calcineurin-like family phosphatase)
MQPTLSRREFLATAGVSTAALALGQTRAGKDHVAFFLVGDTHYLANREKPEALDAKSQAVSSRLIDWLNRLPGSAIPVASGGGSVGKPRGLIHAGDLIDSGDKNDATHLAMQQSEWKHFEADFGLTGKDGKLKYPVYEVHGNHDAPGGKGLVIDNIIRRNKKRPGVGHLSPNGLHYSWDWGPVHFVNLGIVVGAVKESKRRRRYPPLDSLPFLLADLAKLEDRKRPVVITHHVDVLRYGGPCDPDAKYRSEEWDACDVHAYHEALKGYNVVGVMHGHTHTRNVFRWDGSRKKAKDGVPVFNTDNASLFRDKTQGFLYCEFTDKDFVVREFATKDAWQTGAWTPTVWRVPLVRT